MANFAKKIKRYSYKRDNHYDSCDCIYLTNFDHDKYDNRYEISSSHSNVTDLNDKEIYSHHTQKIMKLFQRT